MEVYLLPYTLYISVLEQGNGFIPVMRLQPKTDDVLKLIGAANTILPRIAIMRVMSRVNDFGEIERKIEKIFLNPCIWQYFEERRSFLGIIELNYNPQLHVVCMLKEE